MPPVERGQKASPLGKLSAKQTEEVPLRWLRAFIVAEARGVVFGEDLFRHGFAAPPSPSGEGLGMPFALLLLGLCSKLTTLPFGEGTRVRQNRPRRLGEGTRVRQNRPRRLPCRRWSVGQIITISLSRQHREPSPRVRGLKLIYTDIILKLIL